MAAQINHSANTIQTLLRGGWREIPNSKIIYKDGYRIEIACFVSTLIGDKLLTLSTNKELFLIECSDSRDYHSLLGMHVPLRHNFPDLYKMLIELCGWLPVADMTNRFKSIVISTDHGNVRFTPEVPHNVSNCSPAQLLVMLRKETVGELAESLEMDRILAETAAAKLLKETQDERNRQAADAENARKQRMAQRAADDDYKEEVYM